MLYKIFNSLLFTGLSLFLVLGKVKHAQELEIKNVIEPIVIEAPMTKAEATAQVVSEPVAIVEMKFNDIPLTHDEQKLIRELCRVMDIEYQFVYALIQSESRFIWQEGDSSLEHHAIGYFQISTINAERMKMDYGMDIYDRFDNLEAGMRILQELFNQFADGYAGYDTETAVIMCYKCGINRGTELMDEGFTLEVVQTIKDTKADFDL